MGLEEGVGGGGKESCGGKIRNFNVVIFVVFER